MARHQYGAHQQAYSVRADQNREIGLRAVAAAILYQGDSNNVERTFCREPSVPAAPATQPSDREP